MDTNEKIYYLSDILEEMEDEYVDGKNFTRVTNIDRKLKDLDVVTNIIRQKYKQANGKKLQKYQIPKEDVPKVKAVFRVFLIDSNLQQGITQIKSKRPSKYQKVMQIIDGVIQDSYKVAMVEDIVTKEKINQQYIKDELATKIQEYHSSHKEHLTRDNCLEHMKLVLEECIQALLDIEHDEIKKMGSIALKEGVEKLIADSEDEIKFADALIQVAEEDKDKYGQIKFEADLEGQIGYRILGVLDKSLLESTLDNDYNEVFVSAFKKAYDNRFMQQPNLVGIIDKVEQQYYKLGKQHEVGAHLQQQLSDDIISIAKNAEDYISGMIVLKDYSEASFRTYITS